MNYLVEPVTNILSSLTVIANIATIILLFAIVFAKFRGNNIAGLPKKILIKTSQMAIPLSFVIAFMSMSGSLFFSEIAKYEPCVLCWYQRIAMYPLVILFGISLIKKETKHIVNYALPLVVAGAFIAGLHSFEQVVADPFLPCTAIGYSVSCTKFFFRTFGYITLPVMSFSAFLFIFTLLLTRRNS